MESAPPEECAFSTVKLLRSLGEESEYSMNIRGVPAGTEVYYDASRSAGFSTFNLQIWPEAPCSFHEPVSLCLLSGGGEVIEEALLCVEDFSGGYVGRKRGRGRIPQHVLNAPVASITARSYGERVFFSFSIRRVSGIYGGYCLRVGIGELHWTSQAFRVVSYRLNPIYTPVNQSGVARVSQSQQVLQRFIERFYSEQRLKDTQVRVLLKALYVHAKIRSLDYKKTKRSGGDGVSKAIFSTLATGAASQCEEEALYQCFMDIVKQDEEPEQASE